MVGCRRYPTVRLQAAEAGGQDRGGRGLLQTGARFFSGDQVDLRDDDRKDEDRRMHDHLSLLPHAFEPRGWLASAESHRRGLRPCLSSSRAPARMPGMA